MYSKLEPRFSCGGGDSFALPVELTARKPKSGQRGALRPENGLITKHDGQVFIQLIRPFALKSCGTQHTRLIFGVFCMD